MTGVLVTSAARTAIDSLGRSLRDVPPAELGATAARAAIQRARIEPDQVDEAESMSRRAYRLAGARWGGRTGDASMVDCVVGALTDPFNKIHM